MNNGSPHLSLCNEARWEWSHCFSRDNSNVTWTNSGKIHRSGTHAFMLTTGVVVKRSVWRLISCDGIYTSSPKAVMRCCWQYSLCRPSSISRKINHIEMRKQLILTEAECGRLIAQNKQNGEDQWPLVLHCVCRHYLAFVNRKAACQTNAFGSGTCSDTQILDTSTFSDVAVSDVEGMLVTKRVSAH